MSNSIKYKTPEGGVYSGFSLIEILIVIGVLGSVMAVLSYFSIDTLRFQQNVRNKTASAVKIEELGRGIKHIKDTDWQMIYSTLEDGPKHIEFNGDTYEIVSGYDTEGTITSSFQVERVFRDTERNIVESGGFEDIHTVKVNMLITWEDFLGNQQNLQVYSYVNHWEIQYFEDTSEEDFSAGILNDTYITNDEGGEILLATAFYHDWCNPSLSLSQYDIPGSGLAKTVFATEGNAYLGTGGNASGISVTHLGIGNDNPPTVLVSQEWDGEKVNKIFVGDRYIYVSTDDNAQEVQILDGSTNPFVKLGWVNSAGSTDGDTLWIDERGVGYVTTGNTLSIFDVGYTDNNVGTVAANSGSRPVLGTLSLGSGSMKVSQIKVIDNYLYIAVDGLAYELIIVDISSPASPTIVSENVVTSLVVTAMDVSDDGRYTYIGTASSSDLPEVYVVDTTSKVGVRPVIAQYETNGTTVRGIQVIDDYGRVLIVGQNGEEYQVVTIGTNNSLVRCGGLEVNSGVNDVTSLTDSTGNVYSYLMTSDASTEFKIIRGGRGGGGADGYGYVTDGYFESRVFDTDGLLSTFYNFFWDTTLLPSSEVGIQLRTGDTSDLTGMPWVGPDGTSSTYFTDSKVNSLPNQLQNHRYMQYRLRMVTNDTNVTPIFKNISLYYAK